MHSVWNRIDILLKIFTTIPEGYYAVWYSKQNPPWYIRDKEGTIHEARWFKLKEVYGVVNDQGFGLGLWGGPKGLIISEEAEWGM